MSSIPANDPQVVNPIPSAKWGIALPTIRKFITALVGVATSAVELGLIGGTWVKWLAVGTMFVSALGIYIVPNTPVQ